MQAVVRLAYKVTISTCIITPCFSLTAKDSTSIKMGLVDMCAGCSTSLPGTGLFVWTPENIGLYLILPLYIFSVYSLRVAGSSGATGIGRCTTGPPAPSARGPGVFLAESAVWGVKDIHNVDHHGRRLLTPHSTEGARGS